MLVDVVSVTNATCLIAAVDVFATLFKLEATRRENDNRIKLLYREIKYTMSTFDR